MFKLKLKLLKNRIVYILHCIIMILFAGIFEKHFEMLLFILFFNAIQNCFNLRFHANTIYEKEYIKADRLCKVITICVEIFYLIFCKSISNSIYVNFLFIFLITFTNALFEFFLKKTMTFEAQLKDKERLLKLCRDANVSQIHINRMVLKYIENKTYQEIADIEKMEYESIRSSIKRTKQKLKEFIEKSV